ncbi:MAG: NUDIX hydrolase [Gloeocapsa sp. DLM2.Bin57]|nr:MAG: NUDIX hydrolase [Gloeocapsa sp. DLM2.Bin57]
MKSQLWKTLSRFVEIKSPWLTLIGEKLQDDQDQILDYWRIEKADSVIVIPILNQRLLFPISTYRPGVQQITLDFPGGRLPLGLAPSQGAVTILNKELAIQPGDIRELTPVNQEGWLVNSSFSNQQLYGFVGDILLHRIKDYAVGFLSFTLRDD